LSEATMGRGSASSEEVWQREPVWVAMHKGMEASLE
jgi:hypothetical protein